MEVIYVKHKQLIRSHFDPLFGVGVENWECYQVSTIGPSIITRVTTYPLTPSYLSTSLYTSIESTYTSRSRPDTGRLGAGREIRDLTPFSDGDTKTGTLHLGRGSGRWLSELIDSKTFLVPSLFINGWVTINPTCRIRYVF